MLGSQKMRLILPPIKPYYSILGLFLFLSQSLMANTFNCKDLFNKNIDNQLNISNVTIRDFKASLKELSIIRENATPKTQHVFIGTSTEVLPESIQMQLHIILASQNLNFKELVRLTPSTNSTQVYHRQYATKILTRLLQESLSLMQKLERKYLVDASLVMSLESLLVRANRAHELFQQVVSHFGELQSREVEKEALFEIKFIQERFKDLYPALSEVIHEHDQYLKQVISQEIVDSKNKASTYKIAFQRKILDLEKDFENLQSPIHVSELQFIFDNHANKKPLLRDFKTYLDRSTRGFDQRGLSQQISFDGTKFMVMRNKSRVHFLPENELLGKLVEIEHAATFMDDQVIDGDLNKSVIARVMGLQMTSQGYELALLLTNSRIVFLTITNHPVQIHILRTQEFNPLKVLSSNEVIIRLHQKKTKEVKSIQGTLIEQYVHKIVLKTLSGVKIEIPNYSDEENWLEVVEL